MNLNIIKKGRKWSFPISLRDTTIVKGVTHRRRLYVPDIAKTQRWDAGGLQEKSCWFWDFSIIIADFMIFSPSLLTYLIPRVLAEMNCHNIKLTTNKNNQILVKGRILLNIETMPKILHYLITSKLLLSNIRFLASFRRLEEFTQR